MKVKFLNQKGITLLETLIALTILVTGIFAALTLMLATLSFSRRSEQEIIIVNLAREGIEIVRSVRDRGVRENSGFPALVDGNYIVDSGTYDDLSNSAICGSPCHISTCTNCQLLLSADGRYVHPAGSPTIFYRMVTIDSALGAEAWKKKIISQIYWSEHGRQHIYTLEDHLTDWRDDGS